MEHNEKYHQLKTATTKEIQELNSNYSQEVSELRQVKNAEIDRLKHQILDLEGQISTLAGKISGQGDITALITEIQSRSNEHEKQRTDLWAKFNETCSEYDELTK